MKLRRLTQNCPLRTKPTKGQRCASQQFWRPNVAMGQKRQMQCEPTGGLFPLLPKTGHVNAQQQNAALCQ